MNAIQVDGLLDGMSLSLAEVPVPLPPDETCLIKVQAAGVIATELRWYPTTHRQNGEPRLHSIPGHEFSGTIASIGEGRPILLLGTGCTA